MSCNELKAEQAHRLGKLGWSGLSVLFVLNRGGSDAMVDQLTPYQNPQDVWQRCAPFPWQSYQQACAKHYQVFDINWRNGSGKTLLGVVLKDKKKQHYGLRAIREEAEKLMVIKKLGALTTQELWTQGSEKLQKIIVCQTILQDYDRVSKGI